MRAFILLELLSEMTQSPYHRVEFNVHNNEQTTSIKLALKPEFTLKDALNEVRNVWSAESKHKAYLANVEKLSVKDSQGFWLPQDSAINCVLQLNDKVDVFVVNKRKPEAREVKFDERQLDGLCAPYTDLGCNFLGISLKES